MRVSGLTIAANIAVALLHAPLMAQNLPATNAQLTPEEARLCQSIEGRRQLALEGSPSDLAAEEEAFRKQKDLNARLLAVHERYVSLGLPHPYFQPPETTLEQERAANIYRYCEWTGSRTQLAAVPTWIENWVIQSEALAPSVAPRISSPDVHLAGPSTLKFLPETYLQGRAPLGPMIEYEGSWKDGLADGPGLLRFGEFTPVSFDGVVGPIRATYYSGLFEDGLPTAGKWVQSSVDHTLETAADSRVLDKRPIVETTPTETGETLVRLMQYPSWNSDYPSRMYFGQLDQQGLAKGDWVDVPWYRQEGELGIAGYGAQTVVVWPDGATQSCVGLEGDTSPMPVPADFLNSSNIEALAKASFDARPLGGRTQCLSTSANGWTMLRSVDYSQSPPATQFLKCSTPGGREGRIINGGLGCEEPSRRRFDVFTNTWREVLRGRDRIIDALDSVGGAGERALCRATGTEPGVNCNVSAQVGYSWPVGEGEAPWLPAVEQERRQAFLAAARRADAIADRAGNSGDLGDAFTADAASNAICAAICQDSAQRAFSERLLSELEAVAEQPVTDDTLLRARQLNRETASVFRAGIGVLMIGSLSTVGPTFYSWVQSLSRANKVESALELVIDYKPPSTHPSHLERAGRAEQYLRSLHLATLHGAALEAVELNFKAIQAQLSARKVSPQRRNAVFAAIRVGKTLKQVEEFLVRHSAAQTEDELYQALIKEALEPLGIAWPPVDD